MEPSDSIRISRIKDSIIVHQKRSPHLRRIATVTESTASNEGKQRLGVDVEVDVRCGFGRWKPDWLQTVNRPCTLVVLLSVLFFGQGFVVGINSVNTVTIERRFELTSSQVAVVSGSFEFSAAISGFVISFLASGKHKARWLTMATFLLALGSLVMTIPHFATGLYEWGESLVETCTASAAPQAQCGNGGSLKTYLYVLALGQILHGVAGGTFATVGIAFVDESVTDENSAMFMGIMYGFTLLGPGFGYILGGQLLNLYVDVDKVDNASTGLNTSDPRWLGAWWVGFLINFTLVLPLTIPMVAFGAELPSAKHIREMNSPQRHSVVGADQLSDSEVSSNRRSFKNLPAATWNLLKYLPFSFITLSSCTEGMLKAGTATFLPKFIQNQFSVTASWAAILAGIVVVPGAAGGNIIGGLICKHRKLKVMGMMKLSIIACIIFLLVSPAFWATCDQQQIAGVNYKYNGSVSIGSLASPCNSDCNCGIEYYDPVCDQSSNVQYFSACHAGCHNSSNDDQSFFDCTCLPASNSTSTVTASSCDVKCDAVYAFVPLVLVLIFTTFLPNTPSDAATLRIIDENERAFGLGLKGLFLRCIGTVPGPFVYGAVTDAACLVWADKCGEKSSCWIYDNMTMSRNYFLIIVAVKVLSLLFFTLALVSYKRLERKQGLSDFDEISSYENNRLSVQY